MVDFFFSIRVQNFLQIMLFRIDVKYLNKYLNWDKRLNRSVQIYSVAYCVWDVCLLQVSLGDDTIISNIDIPFFFIQLRYREPFQDIGKLRLE